jgi:hypothetical protein
MKKYFLILSLFSVSFAFAQDNLEEVEEKLDGAYEKVTLKEREIIPYDHVRESDVIWSKRIWRVIDCKEKVNLPFVHPKMGLVKVVHDAAKKGELQVYNPGEIGETFKETISTQEVQNIGVRNDTISRINIELLKIKNISRSDLEEKQEIFMIF